MPTFNLKEEIEHYRSQMRKPPTADEPDDTGRFKAVFPLGPQGTEKEEEYVARMVRKDREANLGY